MGGCRFKIAAMAKAMKAMKAAKAMKAKRVSVIGTGKLAKALVFKGSRQKTVGGLKKSDLVESKTGKIVSKKASMRAKKAFKGSSLQEWGQAMMQARKELGTKGFVVVKKGTPLYRRAKEIFSA